jgi:heme/copper-type cytochrome/quinol oxidase subunit 3
MVFNLHGSKLIFSGYDSFLQMILDLGYREVFGKKILTAYFYFNTLIFSKAFAGLNAYANIHIFWLSPLFLTLGIFFLWSSNAISEGTTSKISFFNFKKNSQDIAGRVLVEPMFHSNLVRKGFKIGFILFIISEVMLFFGFFWGFFHSSISPTIQIGAVWPPIDVEFITVKGFAIANTVILLTSGATLTVAHYAFELIPQKKNKLYKNNIAFTDSEESFETRLKNEFLNTNKFFFNSAKPEIYSLPFIKKIKSINSIFLNKSSYSIAVPFNIIFNPFKKHFDRNFSLKNTENLVKIYINLMLDATLVLAILFMAFQGTEYFISPVSINTGIYGSTFYMITGLHGAHVFIGSCFLFYCRTAVGPS